MAKSEKTRLDQALLQRGLAPDLKEAQALVMAGDIFIDGQKAGQARLQGRRRYPDRGQGKESICIPGR